MACVMTAGTRTDLASASRGEGEDKAGLWWAMGMAASGIHVVRRHEGDQQVSTDGIRLMMLVRIDMAGISPLAAMCVTGRGMQ